MVTYLLIGFGGMLGANARYMLTNWIAAHWGVTFPYGTLVVNISGSFLLCFLLAVFGDRLLPSLRLVLAVGFLGSYTTFSTFSYEWLSLLQQGDVRPCVAYLLGSTVGGGLAGGVGLALGRLV
jgi:CrcB protein